MDPHDVLGLQGGATLDEAAQAYRTLAKRFHPDIAGEQGAARMIELNIALELLRSAGRPHAGDPLSAVASRPAHGGGSVLGGWLPDAVRRALGRELLGALEPGEQIEIVTPAATWASPSTLLAATDRRLLWLLDDAVGNRVRSLYFRDTASAEPGAMRWPHSTRARLRVQPRYGGQRWTFTDLRPATATAIAGHVSLGLELPRRGRQHPGRP